MQSSNKTETSARDAVPLKGALLLILLAFAWGSFWPVMKIALEEFPIVSFRGISGELGGILILSVALFTGRSLRVPRSEILPLILVSFVTTTCWFLLSAIGVTTIGSGRSALIAYTMPLWAFLLGMVFLYQGSLIVTLVVAFKRHAGCAPQWR